MSVADCSSVPHPWFVLKVNQRSEPVAVAALQSKGYAPVFPTYVQRRRYSDRVKLVDAPLFPGYVFCQFDAQRRAPVLSSLAVQYILGTSQGPVPMPPAEVDAICKMAKAGASPMEYVREGQRARIEFGPLHGLEGIVIKKTTDIRLVLSIELLQRSIFVGVDVDQLTLM
jgi:transcription antitermination factor NusG